MFGHTHTHIYVPWSKKIDYFPISSMMAIDSNLCISGEYILTYPFYGIPHDGDGMAIAHMDPYGPCSMF